jgi:hypothetical protein
MALRTCGLLHGKVYLLSVFSLDCSPNALIL